MFGKITVILTLLCSLCFIYANGQEVIRPLTNKPVAGNLNTYAYHPSGYTGGTQKLFVSYVYRNRDEYYFKLTPVDLVKDQLTFSIKVPDSTTVLVLEIIDSNNILVDDNNGVGYLTYLYDGIDDDNMAAKYLDANYILSYFAPMMLNLRRDMLNTVMLNLFEKAYRLSPDAKMEDKGFYYFYLTLLYDASPDAAKQKLNLFANQMAADKSNEDNLMYAIKAYRLLGMPEMQKRTESEALDAYPNGQVAQKQFLDRFYQEKNIDEPYILHSMKEFELRFNDSSDHAKYPFLVTMLQHFLSRKSWSSLLQYEHLFPNKLTLSQLISNGALILCKEGLDTPGENLDTARLLADKALTYIKDTLKNLTADDNDRFLKNRYDAYADTYALILYKLNQYDSAFYYQSRIFERNIDLKPAYLERYIAYAQKVKGAAFARDALRKKLSNGVVSVELIQQLESLYKESGGDDDEYKESRNRYLNVLKEKNRERIISVFGTDEATDFSLTDMDNKLLTLSSFKNKMIVLDFWATWCGPCLAAFPKMQELINKYRHDPDVVFLFINSLETKNGKVLHEDVRQLLKENNYSFTVLFDSDNTVVKKYKVESIPVNFIIDGEGKIIFSGNDAAEIDFIIGDALKK